MCTPPEGSNVLEITPVLLSPRGGLVVSLKGSPKPLTFLLISGGGRYDADLSIHVSDCGPMAKVEIMTQSNVPDTGAPFLTGMLSGVPPSDATPLEVEGVSPEGLRAWRLGRQIHPAGERLFLDYAGKTIEVIDATTGEVHRAQIFVAALGASNFTYAEAR